jgi:hypothetical protein
LKRKALAMLDAADGAGLRHWLRQVEGLAEGLSIEEPAGLLGLCSLEREVLDVIGEAYPCDPSQALEYNDVWVLYDSQFTTREDELLAPPFDQWADGRLLERAIPDYSYPTWSLPRLPIPPILVSWGSKFGGYE